MWTVTLAVDDNDRPLGKSRLKSFEKKYPQIMREMYANLEMLAGLLNNGMPIKEALTAYSWIHPEKGGVFAIAYSRPAIRLYFYPVKEMEWLVVLTVGDKSQQSRDVLDAAGWAQELY